MKKANILIIFIQLAVILFFWRNLPPQVPLFYSRPWGKEQLASYLNLFLLPGFSVVFFILNNFLFSLFIKEEKIALKALSLASFAFSLFCLITLFKICLLIT